MYQAANSGSSMLRDESCRYPGQLSIIEALIQLSASPVAWSVHLVEEGERLLNLLFVEVWLELVPDPHAPRQTLARC